MHVKFQGADVDEFRYLYDQLATLALIFLALNAATPIFQGRLAATDARWNVIGASVDDRTQSARREPSNVGSDSEDAAGYRMAGGGNRRLSKSRYASISTYFHHVANAAAASSAHYNDIACEVACAHGTSRCCMQESTVMDSRPNSNRFSSRGAREFRILLPSILVLFVGLPAY